MTSKTELSLFDWECVLKNFDSFLLSMQLQRLPLLKERGSPKHHLSFSEIKSNQKRKSWNWFITFRVRSSSFFRTKRTQLMLHNLILQIPNRDLSLLLYPLFPVTKSPCTLSHPAHLMNTAMNSLNIWAPRLTLISPSTTTALTT